MARSLFSFVMVLISYSLTGQSVADTIYDRIWVLESKNGFPLYQVEDRVTYKADRGELMVYLDGYRREHGQSGILYFFPELTGDTLTLTLLGAYPMPYQKVPEIDRLNRGERFLFILGNIEEKDLIIQRGTPVFFPQRSTMDTPSSIGFH